MSEESLSVQRKLLSRQIKKADTLDPELLECRVGGTRHRWSRRKPDFEPAPGQVVAAFQCDHCHTIKRMAFGSKYGEVVYRHYQYPEGYQLKRDDGGEAGRILSPAAVRLSLAKRMPSDLPDLDWDDVSTN